MSRITKKIRKFLDENEHNSPFLVVDVSEVRKNYKTLMKLLPFAHCHYAVKANPAPEILKLLVENGSGFDAASINEIRMCMKHGAEPKDIIFGNTVKKESEMREASEAGVRMYTFDSLPELEKIAEAAPGSKVFCRILVSAKGAAWPLSKKFGCFPKAAVKYMTEAKKLGLVPYGLSFHVGSQQTRPESYADAIKRAGIVFRALEKRAGIKRKALDIGGGFPAQYRNKIPTIKKFAQVIEGALKKEFKKKFPHIIIEPGRTVVAEAGVIKAEVVLITKDKVNPKKRWVYLDVGKFTGFVETESIEYKILTDSDSSKGKKGRVVIAGPTCDSVDIIYEYAKYYFPMNLEVQDKVYFLSAGAYTTAYSSAAFNGFPALKGYYIE